MPRPAASATCRRPCNWRWATLPAPRSNLLLLLICAVCGQPEPLSATATGHAPYFRIDVVDQATGRGVPGVRLALSSTSGVEYITDSAGVIAFHEPGVVDMDVLFRVEGDGYELTEPEPCPDKQDQHAVTLHVTPGGRATVSLRRRLAAERLYRINGLGVYRDSRLLGDVPPHAPAPFRAQIVGQDSVYVTRYRDKLFWIWGDTTSLGPRHTWNFETSGATSIAPADGGMDPNWGVDLQYFLDPDGRAKRMVGPASGGTMTWFDGLMTIDDKQGRERLFTLFVQMRRVPTTTPASPDAAVGPVGMWWPDTPTARAVELIRKRELGKEAVRRFEDRFENAPGYETRVTRGLMEFNPKTEYFETATTFPVRQIDELHIGSHTLRVTDGEQDYIYLSGLAPNRRVPADVEAIQDITRYESLTCLKPGSHFDGTDAQLDRDENGQLHYAWRKNTSPIGPREQQKLVDAGHIEPDERWWVLRDVNTGDELRNQHHSIQWNPYRGRYVGVFTGHPVGEFQSLRQLWYGEADTLMGPWGYLEKVVDLKGYAYYNPLLNPYFYQDGGRIVFFEGTYVRFMDKTIRMRPRYNYNQVMHRLDLDDPRVILPVVVYEIERGGRRLATKDENPVGRDGVRRPRFFAADRPRPECVPVYQVLTDGVYELTTRAPDDGESLVAFYAKPADAPHHEFTSVPLWAAKNTAAEVRYLVGEQRPPEGFEIEDRPVCRVWRLATWHTTR